MRKLSNDMNEIGMSEKKMALVVKNVRNENTEIHRDRERVTRLTPSLTTYIRYIRQHILIALRGNTWQFRYIYKDKPMMVLCYFGMLLWFSHSNHNSLLAWCAARFMVNSEYSKWYTLVNGLKRREFIFPNLHGISVSLNLLHSTFDGQNATWSFAFNSIISMRYRWESV